MNASPPLRPRRRRCRHGRGQRGVLFPQQTPRFRTRRELFDMAVLDAYRGILARFGPQLDALDVAVDTVPRMQLSSSLAVTTDEIFTDGPVPLGRVLRPGIDHLGRPTRARIVLFRMAIESRAHTPEDRRQVLITILSSLVANYLNLDPRDVDPRYREDGN